MVTLQTMSENLDECGWSAWVRGKSQMGQRVGGGVSLETGKFQFDLCHLWLDDLTNSMDVNLSKFKLWAGRWWGTGKPGVLQSTALQRVGHNLATEQQLNYLWPSSLLFLLSLKCLFLFIKMRRMTGFAFQGPSPVVKQVVLKLYSASELPGELVKTRLLPGRNFSACSDLFRTWNLSN